MLAPSLQDWAAHNQVPEATSTKPSKYPGSIWIQDQKLPTHTNVVLAVRWGTGHGTVMNMGQGAQKKVTWLSR